MVQSLRPYEVQRQEYIKELVYTERTHLHKLKTMRYVRVEPNLILYTSRTAVECVESVDASFSS